MSRIFLSYVREDQDVVSQLALALRATELEVWLDTDKLFPGDSLRRTLRAAIRDAEFFVACFSPAYVRRLRTYMNEELTIAIDELRQRSNTLPWFIPVRLSLCDIPDRDIGAGETLRDVRWVDLFPDWNAGIEEIRRLVGRSLDLRAARANAVFAKGKLQDALALVDGPEFDQHIGALRIRDEVYKRLGNISASITALKLIVKLDDTDFLSHMKLGNRYLATSEPALALAHLIRAEKL